MAFIGVILSFRFSSKSQITLNIVLAYISFKFLKFFRFSCDLKSQSSGNSPVENINIKYSAHIISHYTQLHHLLWCGHFSLTRKLLPRRFPCIFETILYVAAKARISTRRIYFSSFFNIFIFINRSGLSPALRQVSFETLPNEKVSFIYIYSIFCHPLPYSTADHYVYDIYNENGNKAPFNSS